MSTHMSPGRLRDRPGLQYERTELAWERSTLSLLAAAALLLFHHVQPMTPGRIALAAADVGLAGLTAWLGRRRGHRLRARRAASGGTGTAPGAHREVLVVSTGAVVVALGTALLIAFQT